VKAGDPELSARVAQVLYRYASAIDSGDFSALGELLDPEVILDRPDGVVHGRKAFIDVYRSVHEARAGVSQHAVTNVQASRDDDGSVRVAAYFRAAIVSADGLTVILGRYADILREEPGGFRFVRKGNLVDAVIPIRSSA
jgi:3-phenylpropionate/cinnamic acid dioxygenase small subunit